MRNDISIGRAAMGAVAALAWALAGCAHKPAEEMPQAAPAPAEAGGPSTEAAAPTETGEVETRVDANTQAAAEVPRVGRNDPCPCGSGKRYKLCHGKLV